MSDIAIRVNNLSKSYQITHNTQRSYRTLQEDVVGFLKRPFQRSGDSDRRETFWALKDISFEVKHGEVLGIIGRNGAGKSTLLKILSRITKPTSGHAEIYGRVGSLLEVGTGFHPELTGRENIYLNGAVLGMRRHTIQKHFDEIVAFAEVEQFIDTPVKRYSSGMYMRLAFAVAAHLEPEVLVVDEVLAVGDAEFQKKCLGKMGDIASSGRTVLFVSHNMGAVEQLCTAGIILDQGHLAFSSRDIEQVISHYSHAVVLTNMEWQRIDDKFKNPYFDVSCVSIVDENKQKVSSSLRHDRRYSVHIEGTVESLNDALCIGYALYTDAGQPLYWTYQTDKARAEWPHLNHGVCTLTSEIPVSMLNEGRYVLEIIGGLHNQEWHHEPQKNSPSIGFEIEGGLSDSPYWVSKRSGLLAPVIKWTTI